MGWIVSSIERPTWKTGLGIGAVFVLGTVALAAGILSLSAQAHVQAHTQLKLFGRNITDLSKLGDNGAVPLIVFGGTALALNSVFCSPIVVNLVHKYLRRRRLNNQPQQAAPQAAAQPPPPLQGLDNPNIKHLLHAEGMLYVTLAPQSIRIEGFPMPGKYVLILRENGQYSWARIIKKQRNGKYLVEFLNVQNNNVVIKRASFSPNQLFNGYESI